MGFLQLQVSSHNGITFADNILLKDQGNNQKWQVSSHFHNSFFLVPVGGFYPAGPISNPVVHSFTFT